MLLYTETHVPLGYHIMTSNRTKEGCSRMTLAMYIFANCWHCSTTLYALFVSLGLFTSKTLSRYFRTIINSSNNVISVFMIERLTLRVQTPNSVVWLGIRELRLLLKCFSFELHSVPMHVELHCDQWHDVVQQLHYPTMSCG